MTRNDARKIIKTHTQTRYSNSVLLLLLRVVDLTYRKDKDNAERLVETTAANLMKTAAVGDKQLARILDQLSADGILLDVERSHKRVSCRLNLEPLSQLEPYGDKQKADKKAAADDRARKARERRQTIREISETIQKFGEALALDLGDFVIKSELLKNVKDQNIKRMMLNWDIDRIRRAKMNAESALSTV